MTDSQFIKHFPFAEDFILPNNARVFIQFELTLELIAPMPDEEPQAIHQRTDKIVRANVQKWAAKCSSMQDALAGYDSLETQLKQTNLNELSLKVLSALVIEIVMADEQPERIFKDRQPQDRVKRRVEEPNE